MADSYGQVWLKIIVHGFVLFPWYCVKFVLDGFRCRSFLTPLKKNCSMNGRNKGGLAVPIAFEALAFICCAAALHLYKGASSPNTPVAYGSLNQLLAPDMAAAAPHTGSSAVRMQMQFPAILGNHADEAAQRRYGYTSSESRMFALLDQDSLVEMMMMCNQTVGASYKAKDGSAASYMGDGFPSGHFANVGAWTYPNVGAVPKECDFLTISQNCMCVGVMDDKVHAECHGKATSGSDMLDASGNYVVNSDRLPRCKAHAGLHRYIDMANLGDKWGSNTCMFLWVAVLMSFSRLVAAIAFPAELRKPGSMWVNGWPAALMCLASTSGMKNYSAWLASAGVNYFGDDMLIFGYNNAKQWGTMYPYANDTINGKVDTLMMCAMAGVVLNICCSFFSSESYCNDLTGYAYSKENIQARVKSSRKQKC